jgi:uncharacterized protein YeaO (DUF488 family)
LPQLKNTKEIRLFGNRGYGEKIIKIKRIYETRTKEDGFIILVDRLWPRGLSKGKAKVDLWLRDIAPSDELRKWFAHDPKKWKEFENKYQSELKDKKEFISEIKQSEKEKGIVTLVYSAKDEEHNNAVALINILKKV